MFTRDEVRQALESLLAPDEADEAVSFIYSEAGGFENVADSPELLDALAALSEDAAERVRQLRSGR